MRRFVDHVLCKLPFEEDWFRQRGCHATFVGHPYFDELRAQVWTLSFSPARMTRATVGDDLARLAHARSPTQLAITAKSFGARPRAGSGVRFAVAVYKESQLESVRRMVSESGLEVDVQSGRTAELIHASRCCMACSGSVSLELLYHTRPAVILYQISRFGYFVQSLFRKVRYITLVNLLTAEDPFAERAAGIYHPEIPVTLMC